MKANDIPSNLEFSEAIAGCPFIGCVFFGAANYMGHFNLTAMLSRPELLTNKDLNLAIGEVSSVQRVACKYIASTEVPFTFISSKDTWIKDMMTGMANAAPRSEFVTEDASMGSKFAHYGKIGWRYGRWAGKKVYGWLD